MFYGNAKRFAVSTALLTLLLATSALGSSVEMPNATTLKLYAPTFGGNDGTRLDWGTFDGYKKNSLHVGLWYNTTMEGYSFGFRGWSYGTPGEATFVINSESGGGWGNNLLRVSSQNNSRFSVFGDGRLVSSMDANKHTFANFPYSTKLIIDGNSMFYGTLDFSQAPYQPYGDTNGLIRPRKYTYNELYQIAYYGGAYHGDMAYCSNADPVNGYLGYGNGAWVVYDSYSENWRILKTF